MDAVLRRMLLLRFLVGAIMAAAAVMSQFDMCATIAAVLHFISFRFISFLFVSFRFIIRVLFSRSFGLRVCRQTRPGGFVATVRFSYGCGCCLASE